MIQEVLRDEGDSAESWLGVMAAAVKELQESLSDAGGNEA